MKFGLKDKDRLEIQNEIIKNLGSSVNPKIYIYGSRAKGKYREHSDIDILLVADSYDEASLSKIDFEDLDTIYKVDFVLDKNLFEGYRKEIYSHMIEL